MSDRIAVFEKGRIVEKGAPTQLFKAPSTRFVASFLGENNFVRGRRVNGLWNGFGATFPLSAARDPGGDSEAATLWLRPGDIGFGAGGEDDVTFKARVEDFAFGGTQSRLTLSLADGETIIASISGDLRAEDMLGQELPFHARREAVGVLR